jgi:RimJ/RimL family protein N-acetyltransferase
MNMIPVIETERLTLRPVQASDAAALAARRSDPEVAQYQSWTAPYDLAKAETLVESILGQGGPTDGEWFMVTVTDAAGTIVGDLAIHPTWGMRSVEVGYTLGREYWGRGYASEAVAAVVAFFFSETPAVRLHGVVHPENHASAAVLERNGFTYEGRTKLSYWVGDENTDDVLYGLTRDDWETWCNRPTSAPDNVWLVEVTPDNKRALSGIASHASQERFVSPVWATLREALLPDVVDGHTVTPWLRAIEADDQVVGVVLVAEKDKHHDEPYLWRLLVDRHHQRRSIGQRVLEQVISKCKADSATSMLVSWVEGSGSPRPFYESNGFIPTGQITEGETEARLAFNLPV